MAKVKRIKKTKNTDIYMRYIKTWCNHSISAALRELEDEARDKKSYREDLIDKLFDVCRWIATNLHKMKEEDANNG